LSALSQYREDQGEERIVAIGSPALAPEQLARAVVRRGVRVKPNKLMLNLRVDADVLDWWRARGQGYQSEINAVLRAVMDEHLKRAG
jgi:uncharacterized protein (DUF4415 family)